MLHTHVLLVTCFDKDMTARYYNLAVTDDDEDDVDDDVGDDVGDDDDDDVSDDDGQVVSRVLPLQFPVKLLNLLKRPRLSSTPGWHHHQHHKHHHHQYHH